MKRPAAIIAVLVLGAVLGIAGRIVLDRLGEDETASVRHDFPIGGPFALTDHEGRPVTDATFHGRLALIYFGYTFCPDICPTELAALARTMELLGAGADAIQPLFITVDPERDSEAVLAAYVAHFHPRLIGLTGPPQAVRAAAQAYRVFSARVDDGRAADGDYTLDHTSVIYLMGADGRYRDHFATGTTPERMAERIRRHL